MSSSMPMLAELSPLNLSAIALPMFSDEIKAADEKYYKDQGMYEYANKE